MKRKIKGIRFLMRAAAVLAALTAIGMVGLWGIAMPVRNLPTPAGPYGVGTVQYDLIDQTRIEAWSENVTGFRRFRIQLWYPVERSALTGRPAPWMADGLPQIRGIVRTHRYPFFIWDHSALMRSNSYTSAPPAHASRAAFSEENRQPVPADGGGSAESFSRKGTDPFEKYPLILISHGWKGYRNLHSDLAEELASQGYYVAAADHAYGAAAVVFDDGTSVRATSRILPDRNETDRFDEYARTLVSAFSADNAAIIRHLEQVDAGEADQGPSFLKEFQGSIDLDRIGLIGHSTGGGSMIHLAMEYGEDFPGITALAGLDAWVEPIGMDYLLNGSYPIPASLFFRSEQWKDGVNDSFLMPFISRLGPRAELVQTEGTTHEQFTALYMYLPAVSWLGMFGDADPWLFADYLRKTLVVFFDQHLSGLDSFF